MLRTDPPGSVLSVQGAFTQLFLTVPLQVDSCHARYTDVKAEAQNITEIAQVTAHPQWSMGASAEIPSGPRRLREAPGSSEQLSPSGASQSPLATGTWGSLTCPWVQVALGLLPALVPSPGPTVLTSPGVIPCLVSSVSLRGPHPPTLHPATEPQ